MNRLFESNTKVTPIPQLDAKIIIDEAPYISYPQIKFYENFEVYFNSTLRSQKTMRTRIRMMPYQLSFKINTGTQSINVSFVSTNRQFVFAEVSLVYNKSDQRKTIYESYNVETATTKSQSLKTENASTTYDLTSKIKYDADDDDDAYWLYTQFIVFSCNSCSIAPLTDYANNEVYQELVRQEKYLSSSDERLYIDLKRSKGYTDKLEKLTRDDSGLMLMVTLISLPKINKSFYSDGQKKKTSP